MLSRSPGPSLLRDVADVVIVGVAARGLAAAARRAGLRALVLDLFGDDDTRELAVEAIPLRHLAGLRIDPDDLYEQLAVHSGPGVPIVLGTGFEDMPEVVERLQQCFRLIGNGARAVAAVKEPVMLDALLTDLGIPHPRFFAAAAPEGVTTLEKRVGGSGGGHVRPARQSRGEGWYLQEHVAGRSVSALFLGNGRDARLLAFSEQWSAPTPEAPYRYGGAAGPIRLAPSMEAEIAAALASIVAATGLVGLASADLIVGASGWSLIEINPRPGATLDVFDHPPLPPLLRLHIEACEGRLPDLPILAPDAVEAVRAAGFFYAPQAFEVWLDPLPDWIADRPALGTHIEEGEPVCTVLATGRDITDARETLARRTDHLWRALSTARRKAAE